MCDHGRRAYRGACTGTDGWLIMEGDHKPPPFELLQNAAGMLLGRKNYEGFAAVWPSLAGDGRWADLLS
jgi:hypothetical protein